MTSKRRKAALLATMALLLAACSSTSDEAPVCQKAAAPATGPGDAAGLFPVGPGDVWAYRVTELEAGLPARTYRTRVSVLAPTTFGGAAASVVAEAEIDPPYGQATRSYLAKGPGGVTVLGNDDAGDALTRALAPYQVLPFPLDAGARLTSFDCRRLSTGDDLDGDGRADPVDVRSAVTVAAVDQVTVPAGSFAATQVETQLDLTVHLTSGGSTTAAGMLREWYAPGLGLVSWSEYFSTAGQASTTVAELYAFQVGGTALGVTPRRETVLGRVEAGRLAPGGWQTFDAAVTAGAPLVVAVMSASGSIGLRWYDGDSDLTRWATSLSVGTGTMSSSVTAGAAHASFDVDVGLGATIPADYLAFVAPAPDASVLADEDATIPAQAVTAGHVGTRGRSTYTAAGLTPGATVTIATAGLTGAADLRVYTDATRSMQLDCTLMNSSVLPTPEACSFVATGSSAWFAVESGPLNRDGAAYLLLVWSPP